MKNPSTKLLPFEFRIAREFGESLRGEKILIACSGGRDSVALAGCLSRLSQRFEFAVALGHVHHGFSPDIKVSEYRERAARSVDELGVRLGVPVFIASRSIKAQKSKARASEKSTVSGAELKSEEKLREFRLAELEKISKLNNFTLIAFAHHAEDLLETRLIRLIRGTSLAGLKAMSPRSTSGVGQTATFRPFLAESVNEIAKYASQTGLDWNEDPTNNDSGPLRNWIRNIWLPQLDKKRPGSSRVMARSLSMIVESAELMASESAQLSRSIAGGGEIGEALEVPRAFEVSANADRASTSEAGSASDGASTPELSFDPCFTSDRSALDRKRFDSLEKTKRLEVIAFYVRSLSVRNWTRAGIIEVDKRIRAARDRRLVRFRVLGLDWSVDRRLIRARVD